MGYGLNKWKTTTVTMTITQLNNKIDWIHKPFKLSLMRFISLLLALMITGILFIAPGHIAGNIEELNNGYLMLVMLGLSATFIHGVGFDPIFWLWKILFSPYLSWAILFSFIATHFI